MLELRQGRRRFPLKSKTESTATLVDEATLKPGRAYLVEGDARGSKRLIVMVTGQKGLVVRFDRIPRGRPKAKLDLEKLQALWAGGMTQGEIAERFGVTRRTIERWFSRSRTK